MDTHSRNALAGRVHSHFTCVFACVCVCVCVCVSPVPFLETTAVCARYPHNVGQVYNMVIRDLRVCVCVCVCAYVEREQAETERKKKKEKVAHTERWPTNNILYLSFAQTPVYAPTCRIPPIVSVCVCVCVFAHVCLSGLSGQGRPPLSSLPLTPPSLPPVTADHTLPLPSLLFLFPPLPRLPFLHVNPRPLPPSVFPS